MFASGEALISKLKNLCEIDFLAWALNSLCIWLLRSVAPGIRDMQRSRQAPFLRLLGCFGAE